MLYSNMKNCGMQCCVLGFIVSWTTYGFTLYMSEDNDCDKIDETKDIHMLFFVWLCITVPFAFLCMGLCALQIVCCTCACCSANPNIEAEEKWRKEQMDALLSKSPDTKV